MTKLRTGRKRSGKELVVPLILATIGVLGIVGLYFLVPGFQAIDAGLLILTLAFAVVGYNQNIIRGVMSTIFLYIATGMAATFYVPAAPFIGAPFGEQITNAIFALSFGVLTVLIWLVLELIGRALLPDTSLPAIGFLDRLGSIAIYLVIGLITASLVYNAIGYDSQWRRAHDTARLRSTFNSVVYRVYQGQSFWFSDSPPRIYTYDMD